MFVESCTSCSFLSPREVNLLVSTKNCDLYSDPIFRARAEYSFRILGGQTDLSDSTESPRMADSQGWIRSEGWLRVSLGTRMRRAIINIAEKLSNSIIPSLLLAVSSPTISTCWSCCIFPCSGTIANFCEWTKKSFLKGNSFIIRKAFYEA